MKTFFISLLLSVLVIPTGWANNSYSVEVTKQPNQKWRFQRLTTIATEDVTRVSGRLTSSLPFALPIGHVDAAAYTPSGKLIAATTTNYVPSILTHTMKKKGGVRFSATFDQVLPPNAIIKVAFHRADSFTILKPSHNGNIAR